MADAHKCDRCGNFYLNNSVHISRDGWRKAYVVMFSSHDNRHKLYELCDDCIAKFDDFMSNVNEHEQNKRTTNNV